MHSDCPAGIDVPAHMIYSLILSSPLYVRSTQSLRYRRLPPPKPSLPHQHGPAVWINSSLIPH